MSASMPPLTRLLIALSFLISNAAIAVEMPRAALRYQSQLTREARFTFGMDAPIPMLGSQIQQESGYDPNAKSAYASGLAQFTPQTADWISGVYKQLGPAAPLDPSWALRALVLYDKRLHDGTPPARDACNQWAFAMSAYNGGLSNLQKDIGLCKAPSPGVYCSAPIGRTGYLTEPRNRFWPVPLTKEMISLPKATVLPIMLPVGHNRQILKAEIGPVPVDMMNEKFSRKPAFQDFLSDQPMNIGGTLSGTDRRVAIQEKDAPIASRANGQKDNPKLDGEVLNQHSENIAQQSSCEKCDGAIWWGNVELHSARSAAAFKENRGYPRRILYVLQPLYASWGTMIPCK